MDDRTEVGEDFFLRLREVSSHFQSSGLDAALLDGERWEKLKGKSDIDLIVSSGRKAIAAFSAHGFMIQVRPILERNLRGLPLPSFRAFMDFSGTLRAIDLIEVRPKKRQAWAAVYGSGEAHPELGFSIARKGPRVAWRAYKYLALGSVRGESQIRRLRTEWLSLSESELVEAKTELEKLQRGPAALVLIGALLTTKKDADLREVLRATRKSPGFVEKEKNRVVFAGNYCRRQGPLRILIWALARKYIWGYRFSSWPLIAFVGNDGAGKSTTLDRLASQSLFKIDPVIMSMKRKDRALFRRKQKAGRGRMQPRCCEVGEVASNGRMAKIEWFPEMVDFVDRFARFAWCLAWSRAGFGPTLMDRYVTDRLRGEYSRLRFRFFPLEQFFPMPDAFVFFDVPAELSMKRKPDEGHTLAVLREKRINYVQLMAEIDRVETVDGSTDQDTVFQSARDYVVEVSQLMLLATEQPGVGNVARKWRRACWQPKNGR